MDKRSERWLLCRRLLLVPALSAAALPGGSSKPAPSKLSTRGIRPVAAIVAPVVAKAPQPVKPAGVPVVPKSLGFVQKGLHNCGTVAMLLSWAKLHPREAATLVRRQSDGTYTVLFTGGDIAR